MGQIAPSMPARHRVPQGLLVGALVWLGVAPWMPVAAEPPLAPAAEPPAKAAQPSESLAETQAATSDGSPEAEPGPALRQGKGKFVSYKDGTLTLAGSAGPLVWNDIDDNTRAFLATGDETGRKDRGYVPTAATEALSHVKPGTQIFVGSWFGYEKRHGIFIGLNQSRMAGTFVSYKDRNLSLLSTNPAGGSFTKKYGNSIFVRNLAQEIPVEESIDGGAYQRVGLVKDVMATVGEGTIVTMHFLGEGNITKIQLGLPKEPKEKQ